MRISTLFRAALAALALMALPLAAKAQTVTAQPSFVAPRAILDAGNGPTEFRMLTGSMAIFTSQGSGTGSTSGSATLLTLTATPLTAVAPCVGCQISGTGITSGTTVASYDNGLKIGMSSPMTVAAGTAVAWGSACPAAPPTAALALIQAAVGADLPFYTQARICTYGGTGPGGQFVTFPIGAH